MYTALTSLAEKNPQLPAPDAFWPTFDGFGPPIF